MSQQAAAYIESHTRLSTWCDELEFLGFLLAELANPGALEAAGFQWHQAADLPVTVDILEESCVQPAGMLYRALGQKPAKRFRKWLVKSKEIRNHMAHHHAPTTAKLASLKEVRDQLSEQFECVIKTVAAFCGVREIRWCPYPSALKVSRGADTYRMEIISLAGGTDRLLSQRKRILEAPNQQPERVRPQGSGKAKDKSQQKPFQAFLKAQRRKAENERQVRARKEQISARKLRAVDQNFYQMRQLRLMQLDRLRSRMEHEEREWRVHRSILLQDTVRSSPADVDAVFAILALSSPFWLLGMLIHAMYEKYKILYGHD
ncbi:uncharacterized protein ACLA_066450 [Aspergillus clavatus NRRL 1]|uniref:Uncharacterized protein n=1 Tax=Aspergillus clavatus (strain ATCC 1007 / CBS 513.65 / DSM 816 / NCTC 3887 / NRRL 1 / QM 1276 / 107) TaxID=344612 RepID=A1CGC9_ASPCL|nr:uncharacterized protein ACLA_066450 [Aspergillus clavatus NRRL 1]EAW11009.1 hypothetical protein ACLA_066450 [Aspergillus clavatus NRRL 1]